MGMEVLTALTPYLLAAGAFVIVLLKVLRSPKFLTQAVTVALLVGSVFMTLVIYSETADGKVVIYTVGGFPPSIGISYVVDAFSSTLAILVSMLFLALYPLLNVFKTKVDEYFLALYLGLESGLLGIIFTGDLFNMFVMIEVTLVSSYGLIAMSKTKRAYTAVFRYVMTAGVGGLIFFTGVVLTYFAAGTLNIGYLAAVIDGVNTGYSGYLASPSAALAVLFTLLFWGLMVDEALAPLHFWLPGAYSSAHPVISSLLAGASEGAAYYALMRVFYTVLNGFPDIVANALRALGVLTIIVGGIGMMYSRRLSEIISYSVILDSGYIAVALSLGPAGVQVTFFYIIAHMVVKPLLFLIAGWAREEVGSDRLDDLQGVLRESKILQAGLLTGASAVIGIPPTVLFAAKLQLYIELLSTALANPLNTLVLAAALAGSGLSLASFIKVIVTTILSPKPREGVRLSRVLEAYVIALAGLTIALGIFYTIIQEQLTAPASNILLNGRGLYINEVLQALFRG